MSEPRYGVTSLPIWGVHVTMPEVDKALRQAFERLFGANWPMPGVGTGFRQ